MLIVGSAIFTKFEYLLQFFSWCALKLYITHLTPKRIKHHEGLNPSPLVHGYYMDHLLQESIALVPKPC
jgi:hypothetical protein